jgi:hypothetical protein
MGKMRKAMTVLYVLDLLLCLAIITPKSLALTPQRGDPDVPQPSTLTSGWGTRPAQEGLDTLTFVYYTMPPVMWPNIARREFGDTLDGFVQPTDLVTNTNGTTTSMTMTFALDDVEGTPDAGVFTAPCQLLGSGPWSATYITGTVTSAQCVDGEPCTWIGRLYNVKGQTCSGAASLEGGMR